MRKLNSPRGFWLGLSFSAVFALGVMVSPHLFGLANAGPAQQGWGAGGAAPAKQLSECVSVTTWVVKGDFINRGGLPNKMVRVPAGWVAVGGGPQNVIMCH